MKIPKSIRIAGVDYEVTDVDFLNNGSQLACGHIDFDRCCIEMTSTIDFDYQQRCITFLHEVLHGIIYAYDIKVENEEDVVEMLGRGLYQVLQDNGRELFDIVPAKKSK